MLTHYAKFANATVMPEAILPIQFFQQGDIHRPEERLLLALIELSWGEVEKYHANGSRRGKRIYAEAVEWFLDDSDAAYHWPFSFVNAAGYLKIEPSPIRALVREKQKDYHPVEKGPLEPLSRRSGTRKERKGWVARAKNRRGYEVWVRWEQGLYRVATFTAKGQAENYLSGVRKNIRAEILGRTPTEMLPTNSTAEERL